MADEGESSHVQYLIGPPDDGEYRAEPPPVPHGPISADWRAIELETYIALFCGGIGAMIAITASSPHYVAALLAFGATAVGIGVIGLLHLWLTASAPPQGVPKRLLATFGAIAVAGFGSAAFLALRQDANAPPAVVVTHDTPVQSPSGSVVRPVPPLHKHHHRHLQVSNPDPSSACALGANCSRDQSGGNSVGTINIGG